MSGKNAIFFRTFNLLLVLLLMVQEWYNLSLGTRGNLFRAFRVILFMSIMKKIIRSI